MFITIFLPLVLFPFGGLASCWVAWSYQDCLNGQTCSADHSIKRDEHRTVSWLDTWRFSPAWYSCPSPVKTVLALFPTLQINSYGSIKEDVQALASMCTGFIMDYFTLRSAQLVNHLDTYRWPLCNAWHQGEVLEPDTKTSQPLDPNLRVALEENWIIWQNPCQLKKKINT